LEHLRRVDFAELETIREAVELPLLDASSGATTCTVSCIKRPPGEGSPAGTHIHLFDQIFYILSGRLNLEIAGCEYIAEMGTLVVIPARVPHRNWNAGTEPTIRLTFNAPLPASDEPFSRPG